MSAQTPAGSAGSPARETSIRSPSTSIPPQSRRTTGKPRPANDRYLLPLMLDLGNPSPALGWASEERASLEQRGPADVVLALALVHHLAIGNNVPLPNVAEFFARLGRHLVIEFVPKSDSQVQRMLSSRTDISRTTRRTDSKLLSTSTSGSTGGIGSPAPSGSCTCCDGADGVGCFVHSSTPSGTRPLSLMRSSRPTIVRITREFGS